MLLRKTQTTQMYKKIDVTGLAAWRTKWIRIMKLSIILLTVVALQVSATGHSQGITLSLKNVPINVAFAEIRKQTNFDFFYDEAWLKNAKKVSIEAKDAPLDNVLEQCFKSQPFTYTISGSIITIRPRNVSHSENANVQTILPIDVRGRVVNEKGEPAVGVTVTIKGTEIVTSTNNNGEFSLRSIDREAVLVFTSVNMETFEYKVSGRSELSISLRTKISALREVTVTVNTGYQLIPKERATGQFEFISNEELNRRVGSNILSRLEGVTTGLLIDKRFSQPSNNTIELNHVMIGGLSTLTGSPETIRSALIIVNNLPYEGNLNNINPNDIESITILKDAAAASIYGARAANGVIVITTKQGQANRPLQVYFNTNINITKKPDLFKLPFMSSSEYIDVETMLFNQGFYNSNLNDSKYPALSPVVEILAKRRAGLLTASDSTSQIDQLRSTDVRSDFEKYIYRTSVNQQYSLNLNGGTERARYSISGGFDKGKKTLIGDEFRRITLNSTNNFSITKKFELQFEIRYSNVVSINNSLGDIGTSNYNYRDNSKYLYPYATFKNSGGDYTSTPKDYREGYTDTAGAGQLLNWKYKPIEEIKNSDKVTREQDILVKTGLNYRFTRYLTVSGLYQYEHTTGETKNYYSPDTYFARHLINLYTNVSETNTTLHNPVPMGGILDQLPYEMSLHIGRTQINFNHSWHSKHQFDGIIGGELKEVINSASGSRTYGFDEKTLSSSLIDNINRYPLYGNRGSQLIPPSPNSFLTKTDHFVSVYSNAAYTYDKKYTISGSVRKDAANLFGVDINNKWQPFWSVGGSWLISNESFFKSKIFSYLKIRSTYGYMGNVNNSLSPYTIISYYGANYSPYNLSYALIRNSANPGLSWETTKRLNLGVDFNIKDNRISGSIDLYKKSSDNLILSAIIDPTTGVSSIAKNSASMIGKGMEISLHSLNIKGPLSWNSELLFSWISNKVTDYLLDDKGQTAESVVGKGLSIFPKIGYSPFSIFSYKFAGLDPNTGDPQGYLGKTISKDYLSIFNEAIDTANVVYHGSAIPTVFGNLNNIISYKGVSATINISYRFGYSFKKRTISYYDLYNSGIANADYSKRWQKTGDELRTSVPSMVFPLSNNRRDAFYENSSANILKGDNVRLEYIKLGYTIPSSIANRLFVKNTQIYSTVENLGFLWRANKEGLDPDFNSGNAFFLPSLRISVGISCLF
jgi:TonB-linked SusC/RagA family outer membrane protein